MTYTEIITLTLAILGTVATIYSIRLVVLTFRADHERRKKQATIEYAGQILREARFKIDTRYRSKILTDEELSKLTNNPEDYAEWRNALGAFEHLAVGINAGVYDKDILYRMFGSYIIELFSLAKPYIDSKRKEFTFAYAEFEALAVEFEDRHKHRPKSGDPTFNIGNIRYSVAKDT